ncbi:Glyoxylase, beta-lactamase superfamily II [Paenibacillaceae bacterium GAS479]|nr:Glyoxylase, beta-lactamase superfamily II [Paenibacillaceae bacterium GAS479]
MSLAVKGLHRIPCLIGGNKPLYQHVLEGEDTVVWIDTGIASTPQQEMIPYWQSHASSDEAGQKKQLLVITHADVDHFGGYAQMKQWLPQLSSMAHRADVAWIADPERIITERYNMHAADGLQLTTERIDQLKERGGGGGRIDMSLAGGETIQLGEAGEWQLLHTPGHTPGHLILWEQSSRTAVIGDAVLGCGLLNTAGELVAPPPYYDCGSYRDTIQLLRSLQPDVVYSSHFPVMEAAAFQRFLDESLEMTRQLEHVLVLLPKGRSYTLGELCLEAGTQLGYWPESAWNGLCDPLSAHLLEKSREGSVRSSFDEGLRLYSFN